MAVTFKGIEVFNYFLSCIEFRRKDGGYVIFPVQQQLNELESWMNTFVKNSIRPDVCQINCDSLKRFD